MVTGKRELGMKEVDCITKYDLKIGTEDNTILICDKDTSLIFGKVDFKNAEKYGFYFEYKFLNDFFEDECQTYLDFIEKIKFFIKNEKDRILQRIRNCTLILRIKTTVYQGDRYTLQIKYIKNGEGDFFNKVVEGNEIENEIKKLKEKIKWIE